MNSPFAQGILVRASVAMQPNKTQKGKTQRREDVSITIVDKSKGRKKAPAPSKTKKPRKSTMGPVNLSPCVRDYAYALVDPFDGPLTCVPSAFPPIPSFKARVWNKGFVTVGTGGVGYILVNPQRLAVSDSGSIWRSGPTYAGAGFPATSGTVGNVVANTNAPYAQASIAETAYGTQYRVVSAGIRVWYQDTELNLSGEMLGVRQPDNQTLVNAPYDTIQGFPGTRRVANDSERNPLSVTWLPVKPSELEYSGAPLAGAESLGIMFTGVNGVRYGYDVYAIVEYIGYFVNTKTMSHADPAGFAAVLTAVQSEGDTWYGNARDAALHFLKTAAVAAQELTGSKIGRLAMNMAGNWAMGRMNMALGPNQGTGPESRVSITELKRETGNFGHQGGDPPSMNNPSGSSRESRGKSPLRPVFDYANGMNGEQYSQLLRDAEAYAQFYGGIDPLTGKAFTPGWVSDNRPEPYQ